MSDPDLNPTSTAGEPGGASQRTIERELPQQDSSRLWQPYVDPPLLTPPMIFGLDEASPDEQQRLQRYLAALVATRCAPVHVNIAFNAAYFGFDLEARGYVGGALNDLFTFPEVHVEQGGDALPVGALINLSVGQRPLFAEVLYKEGAHPLLGNDGSLPEWLSGAPAGASGPGQTSSNTKPVLRERLVIDTDAFGADLSMTAQQLTRLRRRADRGLDANGHVLLDARYASREDADLDEVSFYARYLLTRGREQLLSASAPLPLTTLLTSDASDEQFEAALLGLLRTVSEALERIGELRIWRGYAFTRANLGARLKNTGALGGADLETVATQMRLSAVPDRPSRWRPPRKVTYTAIGPRLRKLGDADGQLTGLGYALAVCHANVVVSDYVRGEADETTGLLSNEVSLRLDDPWQGGGVWRAEHPGSVDVRLDITQPLGRGWAATLPSEEPMLATEPAPEPTSELEPGREEEGNREDDASELTVSNSQISWTQSLRLSHQLDGRLPLPPQVASAMRGGAPRLRLMLTHDGYELSWSQAQQNTGTELHGPQPQLDGVDWPLEYFPGIVLTCTWPRGGGVVRATSTLLDVPVTVDGVMIEHRYDAAILTRETAPGEGRRGSSTGVVGTLTLAQRVLRAVRRLGLLEPGGRAVLPRSDLAQALYDSTDTNADSNGVRETEDAALDEVVDRLEREGDLSLDVASVDTVGRWQFPAQPGQRMAEVLVYVPSVVVGPPRSQRLPAQRKLDRRFLRTTEVAGHLRYIAHLGWDASAASRAAYREDRKRFGLVGPAELPSGYTYVSPSTRGN